jgi:hypothetical protein
MGENRKKWYIHNNKNLLEFDTTIKGKTLRRRLQGDRMKKKDWKWKCIGGIKTITMGIPVCTEMQN